MLELPGVTLLCADTANHALALRALAKSQQGVRFGRVLLLTDALPPGVVAPDGVDIVPIAPLTSREAYSQLVLKGLLPHVDTSHALVIQWDGYVVNPEAWDPAFLDCDYIGAKWYWHEAGARVGNGGFSLRSRKLLAALEDPRIVLTDTEDTTIGRTFRPLLEREHGIRFADEEQADRFSFEAAYPIGRPFGFHGLFNFCRTVPPAEIAALAPSFSDAIARSPQLLCAPAQLHRAGPVGRRARDRDAHPRRDARACRRRNRSSRRRSAAPRRHRPQGATIPARAAAASATSTATARSARRARPRRRFPISMRSCAMRWRFTSGVISTAPSGPIARRWRRHRRIRWRRTSSACRSINVAAPTRRCRCSRRPQRPCRRRPSFTTTSGFALAAADRTGEAIAAHRRALALRPEHAIAWSNLGLALQAENRLPEAIDAYRRAIALAPDFAQAHWNLGLALLAHQDFEEGWREYEWRHRAPEFAGRARAWPGPRWDGADPAGRTLLVTSEQGLGDTLQFIRLVQPIAARGARVIVSAEAPLVRLLATAPGVAAVFGPDDKPPAYDAQVPLLDLAGMLRLTPTSIPVTVPYLAADVARRATVANMLAAHAGVRKVGIAWSGSRANTLNRRRSIPLAALAALFALPGIAWFSLQRSIDEEEIAGVPEARALHRLPAREDFDGMAALVAELDLIVSIDTSIVHLGGALGRPTWMMLAAATDWRWHTRHADTPWYPTLRLFRQPRAGDWDAVVRDVAAALLR